MKRYTKFLPNEEATLSFGKELANCYQQGSVIYLYGDLGSGKTTFCRGILYGLGYQGNVKSPTYTLVEIYTLPICTVYHFDFYRVKAPKELEFIGIRDFFDENAIFLVEWPQRGRGVVPKANIILTLDFQDYGRKIKVQILNFSLTRN